MSKAPMCGLWAAMLAVSLGLRAWCAEAPAAKARPAPPPQPTAANIAYGPDSRQVLDFWKAPADKPTPVIFYIHGGAWVHLDKNTPYQLRLTDCLAAGVSLVAINYRYVTAAQAAGVKPPVKWPLADAALALQFVRSKAGAWGLDKTRIGATGGSAGGCSALWLAFHDDMADPASADPIARESTRLTCAGVIAPQTSLDPRQMREWIPNSNYGGHAFGFTGNPARNQTSFDTFLARRDSILPWLREYSPYEWVSADDPPIFMSFLAAPAPAGQPEKDPTHSPIFGLRLREKLDAAGVECHVAYPGAPDAAYPTALDFLIARLKR